jgi:type IV pilus assembly protein PilQ
MNIMHRLSVHAGQAWQPWSILARLALTLLAGLSIALPAAADNSLSKLDFLGMPGNSVRLTLDFADQPAVPLSFTTDNPARLVLDFPGVQLNLPEKSKTVGIGSVQAIHGVEAEGRARVVVELVRAVPYDMEVSGNQLILVVGESSGQAPKPQAVSAVQPERGSTPTVRRGVPAIDNIDFRRGENGAGRIIVTLSDPRIVVDMREEGGKIVVDFKNTQLPERLDRRLDVTDFATPVVSVDTKSKGKNAQMEIKAVGQYEHLAYQTDNLYTIEVKQVVPEEEQEVSLDKKVYTGERMSLNFQNIDIHAVLNLIADFKQLNLVTTDAVKGAVTLRLKNVPWDQALDIILESKQLAARRLGNVLAIDLKSNIEQKEQRELEAKKKKVELEPLRTEFIQVNYSKAEDLVKLLKEKGTHSMLSERGNVSVDPRTNTLVVQDTADRLAQVRRLVIALDTPVRQVLIESRVVIASDDFSKDLGVKFGQSTYGTLDADPDWFTGTGGKREGDTDYGGTTSYNTGGNENFIVDLPAVPAIAAGGGAAFGLALGKIGTYLLQLELSAMQSEGRGEIVSSPRVITADKRKAVIKQGVEIVVLGSAGVGAVAPPEFKEVVLQLDVTPRITPDDRIIMDLDVKKDNVTAVSGAFQKRQVTTQVLVDNGETVVLGGVYEQTVENAVNRVPFFSDLPVLGFLFKRTKDINSKSELLIFVTPKIIKEQTASGG